MSRYAATAAGRDARRVDHGNLRDFNRRDLAAAKKRLSGFAVIMLLEHYAESLLAFCKRLGWPNQSCRIMSKPKSHIGAAGIAAAAPYR